MSFRRITKDLAEFWERLDVRELPNEKENKTNVKNGAYSFVNLLSFISKLKIHVLAYIISTQSFHLKSWFVVHCPRAIRLYLDSYINIGLARLIRLYLVLIKLSSLSCRWVFRLASAIAAVKAKLGPPSGGSLHCDLRGL